MHDEVAKYLLSKPSIDENKLLVWWKVNERRLPRLATLARKYLGIPATKKHCEKLFEPARILMRGPQIDLPVNVVNLNFLHETYNSM